ncbi:MAG: signal peptidase II [Oscillospiraceae bacterium]|nr:signal peptidase II [Oscillospiraceae bacterium]
MVYFILAFLIVLADQAVKYLVTLSYGAGGQWDILPGILSITFHKNTGGAFSMLNQYTMVLAIASAVVCVIIIILLIACKWSGFGKLSLAFILGGAIGNLIDRFFMGYVVDMFYPRFINFAIFNVADIFITIGALLLILFILFGKKNVTPMTAAEKKQQRMASKYGPDVDESTIVIPADQIRAAEEALRADPADEIETDGDDITMVYKTPVLNDSFTVPDKQESGEITLEDIMKEYGHDY